MMSTVLAPEQTSAYFSTKSSKNATLNGQKCQIYHKMQEISTLGCVRTFDSMHAQSFQIKRLFCCHLGAKISLKLNRK